MEFINLTDKIVRLNDGREFPPSGHIARIEFSYEAPDARFIPEEYQDLPLFNLKKKVVGLPPENSAITLIVEREVLESEYLGRGDTLSPAYGHPDCVLKDGLVYSVPGFIG